MQQALRPYATSGVAIVGAALIAVAPVAPVTPPQLQGVSRLPAQLQQRAVRLAAGPGDIFTPYTELFANTLQNLAAMGSHAFEFPILQQFLSDPGGTLANLPNALNLLTSLTPQITTSPDGQTIVDLPPLYIMALAMLGPTVNFNNALVDISRQVFDPASPGDPLTALLGAPATLLNAYLNGQSDIDLLGIHIPAFNGLLAPGNAADINVDAEQLANTLNLGGQTPIELLDQLGVGQLEVAGIVNNLLDVLGLGAQTPNGLLGAIGLADISISSLASLVLDAIGVGNPTVGELVDKIGLGDVEVANVAKELLNALGIGNPTVGGLVDLSGLGDISVADLAKNLLDGLGIGDPTVSDLFDQLTGGNMTVGGVLTVSLEALGLDSMTPAQLLDSIGAGDLTLVGTVTSLFSALGVGDQNLSVLLDAWGVGDVNLGGVVADLFGATGDQSVATVLEATGLGNITAQDIVDALGIGTLSLQTVFRNLINMGAIPGFSDISINQFIQATGGTALAKGGDTSFIDSLGDQTINKILADQGMANQTLVELLGPNATMSFNDFIELNFTSTVNQLLTQMGYDNLSLNALLEQLMQDQPLASLFPNVGLAELVDQMGLNNMSITSVLNDSGIGTQHLFTLIDQMLGNTTVGSLVNDSDIGSTNLFTLIDQVLAGTTIGSMLDDSGIGGQHLDSFFDQIFGTATVASMLTDAGIGDVDLNTLVSQMLGGMTVDSLLGDLGNQTVNQILDQLGLADMSVINANIGEFFGSLPYMFNGLAEQLAQALGG